MSKTIKKANLNFICRYYDRKRIISYLEKMALKGWMLEKMDNFTWTFRAIEPQKLRFAIAYYTEATEFDSVLSENQLEFIEYCTNSGWKFVSSSVFLYVFYTESENTPELATDPVVEVESIARIFKKQKQSLWVKLFIAWLFILAARTAMLFIKGTFEILDTTHVVIDIILCIVYADRAFAPYIWLKKARVAAQEGRFLSPKRSFMILLVVPALLLMLYAFSIEFGIITALTFCFCTLIISLTVILVPVYVRDRLKKKQVEPKKIKSVTIAITILMAVFMVLLISLLSIFAILLE